MPRQQQLRDIPGVIYIVIFIDSTFHFLPPLIALGETNSCLSVPKFQAPASSMRE